MRWRLFIEIRLREFRLSGMQLGKARHRARGSEGSEASPARIQVGRASICRSDLDFRVYC